MSNCLKQIREGRDITQEELAKRAGITRSHLSMIENGRTNPTIGVALNLAKGLNVSVNDIFFTEGERHAAQLPDPLDAKVEKWKKKIPPEVLARITGEPTGTDCI